MTRNVRTSAIVGLALVLPFTILELVNRLRDFSREFPVPLFLAMWLLASTFTLIVMSIVRNLRTGYAEPGQVSSASRPGSPSWSLSHGSGSVSLPTKCRAFWEFQTAIRFGVEAEMFKVLQIDHVELFVPRQVRGGALV